MYDINTSLSDSETNLVTASVLPNTYIFSFVSNPLSITTLQQGTFNVHFHAYRAGGGATTAIHPELYVRSASGAEYLEFNVPSDITLTTNTADSFTSQVLLTSSVMINTDDRLVCKFKMSAGTSGNPTITMPVDGQTGAGITIPIPSANFVL